MLIVNEIIGRAAEPRFAGRRVQRVAVAAADAGRRRIRLRGEDGSDIAIDLPKPAWLCDGAVLHDDGERIVVVVRPPEPVMVITLAGLPPDAAVRLGHALGNRHSALEIRDGELVVPVTDTPELTSRPVLALGLPGLALRFENRPFAAEAPPACGGASHEHASPRADLHVHHHDD